METDIVYKLWSELERSFSEHSNGTSNKLWAQWDSFTGQWTVRGTEWDPRGKDLLESCAGEAVLKLTGACESDPLRWWLNRLRRDGFRFRKLALVTASQNGGEEQRGLFGAIERLFESSADYCKRQAVRPAPSWAAVPLMGISGAPSDAMPVFFDSQADAEQFQNAPLEYCCDADRERWNEHQKYIKDEYSTTIEARRPGAAPTNRARWPYVIPIVKPVSSQKPHQSGIAEICAAMQPDCANAMNSEDGPDPWVLASTGRFPKFQCFLDESWKFLGVKQKAMKSLAYRLPDRMHPRTAAVKALSALETAVVSAHEGISPQSMSDFWRSWQVEEYITTFCAILNTDDSPHWFALNMIHGHAEDMLAAAIPREMQSVRTFPKRAKWLREKLDVQGIFTANEMAERFKGDGPDRRSIQKVLDGECVGEKVLRKLAHCLAVNERDIPYD